MTDRVRYHEATEADKPAFTQRGYKGRYFFPHRVCYVPKPFPEQRLLARTQWGLDSCDNLFGALLYAGPEQADEFPEDVWLDRKVMVHGMHLGRPGLVASAYLYIDGDTLYTDEHQSDMVQRIGERKEHRNLVVRRFGSWHYLLLNSVLHFAAMRGLREVHVPTAERVLSSYIHHAINTDLIERLYDRDITLHHLAERRGDRWVIDIRANRDRLVALHARSEPLGLPERRVCLLHDIASATQHDFSKPPAGLDALLSAERDVGVHTTYCVPGVMLDACRQRIDGAGHDLALRSYLPGPYRRRSRHTDDEGPAMRSATQLYRRLVHRLRRLGLVKQGETPTVSKRANDFMNRLRRAAGRPPVLSAPHLCRAVDFYIKGYRPTPGDLAAGLDEALLRELHFEWLLIDGLPADAEPVYDHGLLRIPTHRLLKDAPPDASAFEQLRADLLAGIDRRPLSVIGLPDPNGSSWRDRYADLLRALRDRAELVTAEDVANAFHLGRTQ